MKISKKDILVLGVTLTKSKKTQEPYLLISFIDGEDNSQYSIMDKNLELMQKIQPMQKWKVDINITSNAKFGVRVEIANWIEKIGQV